MEYSVFHERGTKKSLSPRRETRPLFVCYFVSYSFVLRQKHLFANVCISEKKILLHLQLHEVRKEKDYTIKGEEGVLPLFSFL